MSRYKDSKTSVGRGMNELKTEIYPIPTQSGQTVKQTSTKGLVLTPHGIVQVFSSKTDGLTSEQTGLYFVLNGMQYGRGYTAYHTERGLVTLAKRFAAEMAAQADVWTGKRVSLLTGADVAKDDQYIVCRTCPACLSEQDTHRVSGLANAWTVTGDDVGNDWYFCPACVAKGKVR